MWQSRDISKWETGRSTEAGKGWGGVGGNRGQVIFAIIYVCKGSSDAGKLDNVVARIWRFLEAGMNHSQISLCKQWELCIS